MTDPLSRDTSPLTSAAHLSGTSHGSGTAPARTSHSANCTDQTANNVTSSTTSRWTNERTTTQAHHSSSRVAPNSRASGNATGAVSNGSSLSLSASRSPSTAASPHSSRDSSPAGRVFRQQSLSGATVQNGMRSRKNSHDASPHRPPSVTGHTSSVPSAAAIQRALSAATAPQLQPTPAAEPVSRVPRPSKGTTNNCAAGEGNTTSWPISPRLKSPPPSGSRRNSLKNQKNPDAVPPHIIVQNATPTSSTDALPLIDTEITQQPESTRQLAPLGKSSSRGASGAPTLETVQETSGPNTPGNELNTLSVNDANQRFFDGPDEDLKPASGSTTPRRSMAAAASKMHAQNSDSDTSKKGEGKKEHDNDPEKTPRPKAPSSRTSFSSLRQKTGTEPVTRSMTVETEIVNSVAQNAIGAPSDRSSSRAERGGPLRPKASSDTIKPNKTKKKTSRKTPSVNPTAGMYDQHFFSPPDSVILPLSSPKRRRRRPKQPHLPSRANPTQVLRAQPSLSDMFSSYVSLDTNALSCAQSDSDSTVVSEQPSTFQLLRQRSSQWLAAIYATTTTPAKTDSRSRKGTTRADIFEDRVKNEMDEATSDDSEETFVYESNPAEPPIRRSRHHSRTPSGASLTSMGAPRDARQNQGLLSTQKTRSMKFANAYNSADDDAVDRPDGTVRAGTGRGGGSIVKHHHTGRPSRSTTGHPSILDDDSPFPQLNKVRSLTGLPGRQTQNARIAARNLQASNGHANGNGNGNARKDSGFMSSYDLDAEGGDDERTPLISSMGTMRTTRSARRPPTRGSRGERYTRRRQGILSRFAGCIAIIAMLFLLVFGIVGFLFVITTPLTHVELYEIQSVLASETEIMFDLKIGAINPNMLPITVSDVDLNVFAKSKYVGTEKWWREHPGGDWADEPLPPRKLAPTDTAEEGKLSSPALDAQENFLPSIPGSFPDDSDGSDSKQTMLLGRIYHFDSTITFEPSFWKRHVHNATGALRLRNPGNHTELGGSERWERVLLHEFELIVRGTLKYSIPLGGKAYAANVGNRVVVDPQKDDGPGPGEGSDPEDDDDREEMHEDPNSIGISRISNGWKITVHPLEDELSTHERLKRRVWARLLRQL
ncbi:uncharacterized protein PV09_03555 [Verruconis gallopava]|uniref:Vacuolar segregation subunit 7 n=1 Tax=Verruconis gallopava TaxID=253628 RepID=A0A0D2AFE9_9PEZI|nr:uncharacterized protein PV09_03555 [Verruconis gallopava]KIW05693.1 hypothetical protein PV09_03555 [Verruconis gallopava]